MGRWGGFALATRLDRVRRSEMRPVLGGEVEESYEKPKPRSGCRVGQGRRKSRVASLIGPR